MTLILGVHARLLIRQILLKTGSALTAVEADTSGILLLFGDGRRLPATIDTIYCTSWLQVVQFRRQAARNRRAFWLMVLPDTADADTRRRLRAWLLAVPVQRAALSAQARD